MATMLGSQLKALALGKEAGRARTRPSLLFEPKQAADIDVHTIFSLAQAGLEELCSMENGGALEAYKSTLFSIQSIQTDRELQAKDFNRELGQMIASFLDLLSGFILLPACHQVLEYLIRRYKIHVYSVDDIMFTILPYHETGTFVRIVQLLQLEKTRWAVFSGVKSSGAAPPRDVLIQRCLHDMAFLEAICESGLKSRMHATFSSVVLMEVLSSIASITTDVVMKVLPFILNALKKNVLQELRVGGIVVTGVLVNKATLAKETTFAIAEALCGMLAKLDDTSSVRLALLVLIEITQKQDVDHLPKSACRSLIKLRDLFPLTAEFSRNYNTDKFLVLVLKFLSDRLLEEKLLEAIDTLPLEKHVHFLVLNLLQKRDLSDEISKEALKNVIVALEKRFPTELDKCINMIFQEPNNDQLMAFLGEVFQGSLRRPLLESHSTLYASIDHPEIAIRQAALRNIAELVKSPLEDEATKAFIEKALLRRLEDDDLAVVQTVLSLEKIADLVPAQPFLKAITYLIHKCMGIVETGSKKLRPVAREIVKACLDILKTHFDVSLNEVQRCLIGYLLLQPKTWELNILFVNVARISFFSLPACEDAKSKSSTKDGSVEWRSKCNQKIVEALADAVLQNPAHMELYFDAATATANAKHLVALIIMNSLQKNSAALLSKKCFSFLSTEWKAISSNPLPRGLQADYSAGYDQLAVYKKLEKSPSKAYVELLLAALYKVMQLLLPSSNDTLQDNNQIFDELFLLIAGSPDWRALETHVRYLLERMAKNSVVFLSKYFTPEAPYPEAVQFQSLDILTACGEGFFKIPDQLQTSIPCVLTALANTHKSVRQCAIACIKAIVKKPQLPQGEVLRALLQRVIDEQNAFIENELFIRSFFTSNLCEIDGNKNSFSADACRSLLAFLLQSVDKFPLSGQRTLFEVLHDVGYAAEKSSATQPILFQLLQRRRLYHLSSTTTSEHCLRPLELHLLEMLLEINIQKINRMLVLGQSLDTGDKESYTLWPLLEALDVDGGSLEDPAVKQPCLFALKLITSNLYGNLDSRAQDVVFRALLLLAAVPDDTIRPTSQRLLDVLNVTVATVSTYVHSILSNKGHKRARLSYGGDDVKTVDGSVAFLEFLLRKTSEHLWVELLDPLFHLLRAQFNGEGKDNDAQFTGQLILTVLRNIISSVSNLKNASVLDVDLLAQYVIKGKDGDNALAVIAAIAKIHPDHVWSHVIDIFSAVGVSTITQDDSHSHKVVQELLEAVVPSWLKALNDPKSLLQIFIEALPRIPIHRRTELMKCVMRVTNEETSIPIFLVLCFSQTGEDWAVSFADEFLTSYNWNTTAVALSNLSSMVQIKRHEAGKDEHFLATFERATRFIARQSQKLFMQRLEDDVALNLARTLVEYAIKQAEVLSDKKLSIRRAGSCLDAAQDLLKSLASSISPSVFCRTVTLIAGDSDDTVCRKVLQIYLVKLKASSTLVVSRKKNAETNFAIDPKPHIEVSVRVLELLERTENISSRTKKVAASALEILAQRFAETSPETFASFLSALVKNFQSSNRDLAASCVRCAASIISRVGSEALPSLPAVMKGLLTVTRDSEADLQFAILLTFEAMLEKLGTFINPYVEDILGLLVLHSHQYTGPGFQKASSLKGLIATKVSPRVLLDPLIKIYKKALSKGEASTAAVFEIVGTMCSKLDDASVTAYHTRIFAFCIEALDLRRKQPEAFTSVQLVEDSAISAIISLVMKLNEISFKPLFITVHDWAYSTTFDGDAAGPSIERSIPFLKLVNQLTETLRSVFVPYFGYLLTGCVSRLSKEEEQPRKKKKAKLGSSPSALAKWHLRQLIVSALHKCFLYDTVGFLDAPKFQQLLEPLAKQLVAEVPSELESLKQSDMPTLKEADDMLVSCLVRMGLTAGSDLYWKPLNHEVLMYTRRQNQRAKMLALETVKSLAANVKEEFIVLIAETVPFLSELLEDADLTVVAKAQQVLKVLEEVSGESLGQYM